MKSFFTSKKTLILVLALTVVFAAASSYAWFTAEIPAVPLDLEFGDIDVEATFETDDALVEPGLSLSKTGTIKNTGTLAMMAKLNITKAVTVFRDTDGNLLDTDEYPDGTPAPDSANSLITASPDFLNMETEGIVEVDGEYYMFAWMYDVNNENDLYLILDSGLSVDVAMEVIFSESLGNQYKGAVVDLSESVKATQAIPEAIEAELEIDQDDLDLVSNLLNSGDSLRSTSNNHAEIVKWVEEHLG